MRVLARGLSLLLLLVAVFGTTGLASEAPTYSYDPAAGFAHRTYDDALGYGRTGAAGSDDRSIVVRPSIDESNPSRVSSRELQAPNTAGGGARFVVDSAGSTTLRAQGPSGWIDVTHHAARRMTQRGISIDAVDQALTRQPFNYWHNNAWKVGYYDAGSNVFVGTVNGAATTVIRPSAGPQYIANLRAASP